MSLHVEVSGSGPDIVMLHGWGLHGGLFGPLVERLSGDFRVHAVDLPGHGRSQWPAPRSLRRRGPESSLTTWSHAVLESVPDRALWVGWSLGATVAIRAALDSTRVGRLVLVAATPRFVAGPDWPHALDPGTLQEFASGLEYDFRGTVHRFLTLQSLGDENARERIRELRAQVFGHGEPATGALAAGLTILSETDLRNELTNLTVPVLVLAGSRDRLTPPAASAVLAAAVPGAHYEEVAGAAHAPFLSHPDKVASSIQAFAHGR